MRNFMLNLKITFVFSATTICQRKKQITVQLSLNATSQKSR